MFALKRKRYRRLKYKLSGCSLLSCINTKKENLPHFPLRSAQTNVIDAWAFASEAKNRQQTDIKTKDTPTRRVTWITLTHTYRYDALHCTRPDRHTPNIDSPTSKSLLLLLHAKIIFNNHAEKMLEIPQKIRFPPLTRTYIHTYRRAFPWLVKIKRGKKLCCLSLWRIIPPTTCNRE